jgi:hypothetical protein
MNTPKISLKIIRHEYVKNLLGDSYDDHYNPQIESINVGTYTLAHIDTMQEFLSQDEDVTEYDEQMNHWHIQVPLASDKNKTKYHL